MTDEPEDDKFSYQQLERMLERAREERDEARAGRTEAITTGKQWKELADERKQLVENLRDVNKALTIEAAELRGYIRRVNELDPKSVRQKRTEMRPDPREFERSMRRGF